MRVYRMFFVSIMTLMLLSACADNDANETSEKDDAKNEASENNQSNREKGEIEDSVVTALKNKMEHLNSYHASVDMEANLDNDEEEEELNAEVDYIIQNPPSIELTSFDVLRMISVDGKTYFNNNDEWVDVTDSVDSDTLFHTTYENAVQYFSDIFDELKKIEEDSEIKYVYEGNDIFVYNKLEKYLQINFGTVDTSNHHTKIEFTMNDKEDVIEKITFSSDIEDQDGGIDLEGDIEYSNFDQIKEIKLPEL